MKINRTTLITSIGSALEYYDFITYIMLATYLSQIFFPKADSFASILETFLIFAIGYLLRPLGGLIFGHYGDKFGRKKAFLISILLMAFATFSMGLLPSYEQIGVLSTLLLVVLRLIQGVAQGAELPGAITFIAEHASHLKRGSNLGMMMFAVGLGAMASTFVNFVLHAFLSKDEVIAWGWRIPFIIGGILAVVGFYLRRNTEETPLFLNQEPIQHTPVIEVLLSHPIAVIRGILITLAPASFILFALFLPSYIELNFSSYHATDIFLAMTLSLLWSALLLPLFGWLSDYIGRKRLFITAALAALLTLYSLFQMLTFNGRPELYGFMFLYQTLVAMLAACYPSQLAELFPTNVRYTGVAICYNVSYAIAAFIPILASMIVAYTNNPLSVCLILLPMALISLLSICNSAENTCQKLKN